MIKAILLLSVVGISLCQLGGWHDYHGDLPKAVQDQVSLTLTAENHQDVGTLTYTNVRSQVVAGTNFSFDVSFTGHGGKTVTCHFTIFQALDGTASVTTHSC